MSYCQQKGLYLYDENQRKIRAHLSSPITPPDPYDHYRVEEVRERSSRPPPFPSGGGDGEEPPGGGDPQNWIAYFFRAFKRALDTLLASLRPRTESTHLQILKIALETIAKEDRSQDLRFLNQLAKTWNLLQQQEGLGANWQECSEQINSYPPGQVHTFGYYLSHYAGQKWIPFPYMELIQKIHREHKQNPEGSSLAAWISLLS